MRSIGTVIVTAILTSAFWLFYFNFAFCYTNTVKSSSFDVVLITVIQCGLRFIFCFLLISIVNIFSCVRSWYHCCYCCST